MSTGPLFSELLRDEPDMRDLVEDFVGSLQRRLDELKAAHAQADWDRLRTLAHQLKGAGGSYGYPDMTRVAAGMEGRFRQQSGDGFDAALAELQQLVAAAQAGLSQSA